MLGGVCAGIAEYFDIDVSFVRIIFLALFLLSFGAPVMVYFVLWIVLPVRPTDYTAYVDVTPENCPGAYEPKSEQQTYSNGGYPPGTTNFPGVPDPRAPEPEPAPQPAQKQGRGLMILGVILVVVGIGMVIARFVGNVSLWACWPLLVIAWGVAIMLMTPKQGPGLIATMLDGIIVVIIGAVLLFCSIGSLSWSALACIALQWPIWVIAAGVSVVAVAIKSPAVHIAAACIAIIALVMGLGNYQFNADMLLGEVPTPKSLAADVGASRNRVASVDLADVESSRLKVNAGGADFSLVSEDDSTIVLYGSDSMPRASALKSDKDLSHLKVEVGGLGKPGASLLVLPRSVVWNELEIDGGASRLDIDLSKASVHHLDLDAGASTVCVTLGDALPSGSTAELEAGASHLVLVVPESVTARVYVTNAGELNVGSGLTQRQGDSSASTVVEASGLGDVWDVDIDGGVATIDIVRQKAA